MKTLYVSSTDRDMAGERELLHRQVLPALQQAAREYGTCVDLCDLRRSHQRKTDSDRQYTDRLLSVCLDELGRCSPYMIVLVGQRYGQFLEPLQMQTITSQRTELSLPTEDLSLTALEVYWGALLQKDRQDKVLFYFRQIEGVAPAFCQPESEHHARALEALKEKIRAWAGDRVRTYRVQWDQETGGFSGLDAFAALVEADLRALLEPQWAAEKAPDPWVAEIQSHWALARQGAREFVCRNDLVNQCIRTAEQKPALFLQGEPGCGKRTMMSKLAQELERYGHLVLPVFCGTSGLSQTAGDVLCCLLHQLEPLLGLTQAQQQADGLPDAPEACLTRLTHVLNQYTQTREDPLFLLLEGIDRLIGDTAVLPSLLRALPEGVHLVLSGTTPLPETMQTISIPPLSHGEVTEMAQGILRTMKGELDPAVIRSLTSRPETHSPKLLRLLLQRLTTVNGETPELRLQRQHKLLATCPGQVSGLYLDILSEMTKTLGDTMVVHAAAFLAISRYGLRESDLEGIFRRMRLPWDPVSFARLRQAMGSIVQRRGDGRIDLKDPALRETLLECLQDKHILHRAVMSHLLTLPAEDPLRDGELVWHTLHAREYRQYVDHIRALDPRRAPVHHAARDTAQMLLSSGKAWLLNLLEQPADYGCDPTFFAFLDAPLSCALGSSTEALQLHRDILLAVIVSAQNMAETSGDESFSGVMADCRSRVRQICQHLADPQSLTLLIKILEQQLSLDETLLAQEHTPQQQTKLLDAYAQLSALYARHHGADAKRKSLVLSKKRLVLWQKLICQENNPEDLRQLADAWTQCAKAYTALGEPQDLEAARECTEQSIAAWYHLAAQTADSADWHSAFTGLLTAVNAGTIFTPEKTAVLLDEAKTYALSLGESAPPELREDLAGIWCCLGELYGRSRRRESILKALEMYQESFLLYRTLTKLLPTADIRFALAHCYERMSQLYRRLGGGDNLNRALELLNRCLTLRRKLHQKLDTTQTALELALTLQQMGKLCAAFGGEANLLQARKILESALPLHQQVEDALAAAETHSEMIELRCVIAEVDAELAEIAATRRREDEARHLAQLRLDEEERAMEEGGETADPVDKGADQP